MTTEPTQPPAPVKRPEVPQYRLTEKFYSAEGRLCQPDEVIYWKGKPEWYMQPVNDAARAMKEKYPDVLHHDPIQSLNVVAPKPGEPAK